VAAVYLRPGLIDGARLETGDRYRGRSGARRAESTLLDLLDNLLNKGVMANGDVTLGVAGSI